ncbi:sialate O-acetylesterase [Flavicella sp.]|uniref:sialate O-acetylesterase n=1 Tax=Flavicella sp. TaxID=2957742 RepID=UPI0030171428
MHYRKQTQRRFFLLATFLLLCTSLLFSNNLKLGSLFQEHMVLQRNIPIKIWGEALANNLVIIKLKNKTVKVYSDSLGYWNATLPKFKEGGPFIFKVSSANEFVVFTDVMIGEVWVCAGQSNMVMPHKNIQEIHVFDKESKNIRTFEVPRTGSFHKEDFITNGVWELKNPSSAVAFSFSYFLEKYANVPIGIILTAWGSSSIEGWMPADLTKKLPHFNRIMKEFYSDRDKQKRIELILSSKETRKRKDDIFLRTQPNIIFNAMMNPLIPYTCRGIVWYQGESNSKTKDGMLQYGQSFPVWTTYLRDRWKQKSFDFIVVSLPGYIGKKDKKPRFDPESPTEDSWAWMRESQYSFANLANTEVVTTIDLGEAFNIHPKDKLLIGERIALLAEKSTLNRKGITDGPKLKKYKIKNNEIILKYYNSKGLKTVDGKSPKGFWISGEDKEWFKAEARIDANRIILKSINVDAPIHVRYAFSAKPKVNLVNNKGLPSRPFRTDK